MVHSRSPRAFTLIELLVVIAIIGLLSSVVLASLNTAREKARNASYLAEMRQYQTALEMYYSEYGKYPVNAAWACIGTGRPGGTCWNGGYSENSTLSTTFRSAIAPYIDETAVPGPTNNTYSPLYYSGQGDTYHVIFIMEGDGDCPIGVKNTDSTGYETHNVIRCDIKYP